MASVKNLKKDINFVLGDVIEECYSWELMNPDSDTKKSSAIVDEAINTFDTLIAKLHAKDVENKKAHFKAVKAELETLAGGLLDKVNKL
ncbi:hypothetical protein [Urechidicola vernalis]|uniref:Uncharacterized protein n=1 Tax=Urechidicola vernalis TaxID=3075600 RepID=A0ABU2Y0S4_9FLAO|nr:hypothetical protein [Urechidicola sp. P050]MDT0551763.1 hypothetical protein [Urechidicola sp. P050]